MSRLREHKFKHNFQDCLNPISSCDLNIESTSHFLLHCSTFDDEWYTLLSTLNKIDYKLIKLTKCSLSYSLLYVFNFFYSQAFYDFGARQLWLLSLLCCTITFIEKKSLAYKCIVVSNLAEKLGNLFQVSKSIYWICPKDKCL